MFEEISHSNKLQLLGKLQASFVHEIRNPLFALKLNLEYLNLNENLPSDLRESVESGLQALERINKLTDNILEFSKKSNGELKTCSLQKTTIQAIELVRGFASKISCEIEKVLNADILKLNIPNDKLLQVFLNLLTNAIEASRMNSKIIVKTYSQEKDIFWEVQDFGSGILDEDRENIFNDFFTKKSSGTGLGLGICKKILNEINAELNFDSEAGKGSRFFIKFSNYAE